MGYEFVKDKDIGMDAGDMANKFIESMDDVFKNWKPSKKYTMEVI